MSTNVVMQRTKGGDGIEVAVGREMTSIRRLMSCWLNSSAVVSHQSSPLPPRVPHHDPPADKTISGSLGVADMAADQLREVKVATPGVATATAFTSRGGVVDGDENQATHRPQHEGKSERDGADEAVSDT